MTHQTYAYLTALVLIIGGFGVIGTAAGVRLSIAVVINGIDCTPYSGTGCYAVVDELNSLVKILLTGGLLSMVCGSIGAHLTTAETPTAEGDPS